MVSATEGASAKQGMAADLAVGLDALSNQQTVTFTQYTRFVLPADGFIFWLAGSTQLTVKGSLHYSVARQQNEDEIAGYNQVVFTAQDQVNEFNNASPTTMWVAALPDGVQYAFSQQGKYYQTADLFHYTGTAVLPALQSQMVQNPSGFDETSQVVSDSMPFWLDLNSYVPPYPGFQFPAGFTLYPSYAVPENLAPPYGVVHIEPNSIEAISAAPLYDAELSPTQLTSETVRITTYGLRNAAIATVRDAILQYSYDYSYFGVMNMPIIRDEKRTQVEMSVIAMKKTITLDVSYNQTTARSVARQMITKVVNSYLPQPLTAVGFVPPAP